MDEDERIASVFLDAPSQWDKTFRGVLPGEPVYVTEYKWTQALDYGGLKQKQHQRRYKELRHALRRLDYILAKYKPSKAFILDFPVDIEYYTKRAQVAFAKCEHCGSTEFKFLEQET